MRNVKCYKIVICGRPKFSPQHLVFLLHPLQVTLRNFSGIRYINYVAPKNNCCNAICIFKYLLHRLDMARETCVLPVRCKRCSAVFDLWYDLQEQETASDSVAKTMLAQQNFCWDCREEMQRKRESITVPGETEYEIELDFEY